MGSITVTLSGRVAALGALAVAAICWLAVWLVFWGVPLRNDLPALSSAAQSARAEHRRRAGYDPATGQCRGTVCSPTLTTLPEEARKRDRLTDDLMVLGAPWLLMIIAGVVVWRRRDGKAPTEPA